VQDQLLTELGAKLVQESLTDEALLAETDAHPVLSILPDANVVKIGGQSLIDRGRTAVFPLLEEIVANLARHKLIVGAGAGARANHAFSVGIDLGMPTGVLSVLSTFVSMQNARMLHYLLAKHGIPFVSPIEFAQLPLYLEERRAVVFFGMPPYIYWQPNPAVGRIPPHRTDTGAFLVSEVFGARSMIYIKDEDGLYTDDPKKNPDAKFIPETTAQKLLDSGQDDLVVERVVLEYMLRSEKIKQVRIVNGLKRGNILAAMRGENVGTLIRAQ
jgi:molybdenum storage protein